ncbi:TPA: hypothetical protein QCY05_000859 [Bacillus wiedmannii]|nr:hypothetical protein [Bacillus wiedmannii]
MGKCYRKYNEFENECSGLFEKGSFVQRLMEAMVIEEVEYIVGRAQVGLKRSHKCNNQ